jgi:hypothetical protein
MTTASPWNRADTVELAGAFAVGTIVLSIAWFGASGATVIADQIAWLNLAVLGAVVPGMAAGRWVLRGHQAFRRRTDGLSGGYRVSSPQVAPESNGREAFVSHPAMTRYHRSGCLAAAGKAVALESRAVHERAGRIPCEMCRP